MPDYRLAAKRAAERYGIDPEIFLRQIGAESGFNPTAKSPKGAQGIAQFIPSTAKSYGVNLNDGRVTDDLEGAARYMRDALKRTGGNYHQALSIYNSGRPDGYKRFGETAAYVSKILNGVGGTSQRGTSSKTSSRTVTTSRTIPGVDRSEERKALILQFLQTRHQPNALIGLASGLKQAQDTPARKVSSTKTVKGSAPSGRPSGGMSPLRELFYNGPGGINAKDGQREPKGFVSGHTDHVHVAAGPKTVVKLGKLAQQMGLHVGENPKFGGVHPVHVKTSYHYRNEAIDVSGTPAQMERFNRRVAALYGLK